MINIDTEDVKDIYEHLEDEESRDIFANRLMLSMTDDWKFAKNIVGKYLRGYTSDRIFTGIEDNLRELNLDPQWEYIIYGAGMFGRQVYNVLQNQGMCIKAFCDVDRQKQSEKYCGLIVLSPEDLINLPGTKILLAVWNNSKNIRNNLQRLQIDEKRIIDCFLIENYVDKNQYFDSGIIKFGEKEVFLDCGCYDFETSETFLNRCPDYKKIICFEPDLNNRNNIIKKIHNKQIRDIVIQPYGVWNKNEILFMTGNGSSAMVTETGDEQVEMVALDKIISDRVTFIKMDIEGAELKALMGAKNIIQKFHPKLAICAYHKKEDIVEIPKYILSLVPEYKLYLRHYSNYFATETVLYAI